MKYENLNKEQLIAELIKRDSELKKVKDNNCRSNLKLNQKLLLERETNLKNSQRVAKIGHYSIDEIKKTFDSSEELKAIFEKDGEFSCDFEDWLKMVHPDFLEPFKNHFFTDVIKNKKQLNFEYKIITLKTKRVKWIHGLGDAKFDENGKYIGLFGTIQDITDRKIIELNLEDSQRVAKIGHYSADSKKNEITTSEQFNEIFELDRDYKFDFDKWISFIHPDFREELKTHYLSDFLQKGISICEEYKIITAKSKKEKWVHGSGKPIFNSNNKVIGMFGTLQDITERKIIELAHIESLSKLKESQKVAKIGHYTIDRVNKKIRTSEQLREIFELDEKFKFSIEYWIDLIHPEFRESRKNEYVIGLLQNKIPFDSEFKIITERTKQEKWIHGKGNPELDEKGEVIGLFGTVQDITDRKIIEQAHRESEAKLQKLFDKSLAAIFITDINTGKFVDANKSAEKLTGFSLDEMTSISLQMFVSLTKTEKTINLAEILALDEITDLGEIEFFHKDGTPRIANLSILPINKKYMYGIATDLTEKKRIENEIIAAKNKALASDKMKTEFLAQMSHEIRSPINVISNFLSLIKEETEPLNNETINYSFSSIESSTQRIIRTIDLILNMSDLQLGTYSVTQKEIEVEKILKVLFNEYKSIADSKNLKFELKTNLCNKKIKVDDYALKQIIANLMDNAIKYTGEGYIEMRFFEKENKYIFEIEDSGIGIGEDYLSEIFSAFSQESQGYTRRFDGTGLGLSLVKKYCQLINAEIFVKSKKGLGSTFILEIPKN